MIRRHVQMADYAFGSNPPYEQRAVPAGLAIIIRFGG
jgi:hypothetical protein